MKALEMEWRDATRKTVSEFIQDMGNVGRCIKLEALHEQLIDAEMESQDRHRRIKQAVLAGASTLETDIIYQPIAELESLIEKLNRKIKSLLAHRAVDRPDEITDDMIQKAKEYPIADIIGGITRKGNVHCIWHTETHPSMGIKNNRATCFSCGKFGDSIDVYMHLNGCTFHEAARRLQ